MVVTKVMWFDRVAVLLIGLALMLALGGCGGRAAKAPQAKPSQSRAMPTEIELQPTNDSGVKGVAIITNTDGKVRVRLALRGLPEPDKMYLAHLHPGTCGDEDHPHAHEHARAEHPDAKKHEERAGHGDRHVHKGHEGSLTDEIEYPLEPVESNAEGIGSSSTVLEGVTVGELLTGDSNYINVHAAGSGDPPQLVCANLSEAS
jgi:hypothetical protein